MEQKQYGKAQESFDRAIAARSDSPHTFYFRARSLLAQNKFSEALPDLERVVAGDRKLIIQGGGSACGCLCENG